MDLSFFPMLYSLNFSTHPIFIYIFFTDRTLQHILINSCYIGASDTELVPDCIHIIMTFRHQLDISDHSTNSDRTAGNSTVCNLYF